MALPVPISSRSDDRHRDSRPHFVEEGQEPDGTPDVSARFDPLGDDQIASCIARSPGLVRRADLPSGPSATFMSTRDDSRIRCPPKTLHECAPCRRILEYPSIEERNEEVHPDRDAHRYGIKLRCQGLGPDRPAEHAETPGLGNRDSEIGCRKPTHPCLL